MIMSGYQNVIKQKMLIMGAGTDSFLINILFTALILILLLL